MADKRGARDQLLGWSSRNSIRRPWAAMRALPLVADVVLRVLSGGARRPLRSAASSSSACCCSRRARSPGASCSSPTRCRHGIRDHPHGARRRQRAMGPTEPGAAARHRRHAAIAERRALNATSRQLGLLAGPAIGAAFLLALGPTYGILLNAVFYLPLVVLLWKAAYAPPSQRDRPPAASGAGPRRHRTTIKDIRGSRIIVSMILLSGCTSLIVSQRLSGADAELRAGSGPRQCRAVLWPAAGGRCGRRADRRPRARRQRLVEARPQTAFMLVMMWCCLLAAFAMTTIYPLAWRCCSPQASSSCPTIR